MVLTSVLICSELRADDPIPNLLKLRFPISEKALDDYVKYPQKKGLPGEFIGGLIPQKGSLTPEVPCPEDEKHPHAKYEVIAITTMPKIQNRSEIHVANEIKSQHYKYIKGYFKRLDKQGRLSEKREASDLLGPEFAGEVRRNILDKERNVFGESDNPFLKKIKDRKADPFDINGQLEREIMVENLLRKSTELNLPEKDLVREISRAISNVYKSDEEKYNFLNALSNRLYVNYNNARNPGFNNPGKFLLVQLHI